MRIVVVCQALAVLFSLTSFGQPASRYQVLINEIFPDPLPSVGLPSGEFIELKNVSGKTFDLRNWKLSDGTTTGTITTSFMLLPDSMVILCPTSVVVSYSAFGAAIGLSNFPSLNNDADLITLISPENQTIHALRYELGWFKNGVKSEGGWSLEMIDNRNPCGGGSNWAASNNIHGGSPGKQNSLQASNPDEQVPSLLRTYTIDSLTIIAVFDEPLDSLKAALISRFEIDPDIGHPVLAVVINPLLNEVRLHLGKPLKNGVLYQLTVKGVTDCAGNEIGQFNHVRSGLPAAVNVNDLVLNEILFNPKPGSVDYLELYNRSQLVYDASGMYIGSRNSAGLIGSISRVSELPFLIFPGDHILITEDPWSIQKQFVISNPTLLISISALPTFPDDKGNIVLLDHQGRIIDELNYDEGWHFSLLATKEGVSLERIDPNKPTQTRENWTSAASTSGFGTPAAINSQIISSPQLNSEVSIQPTIFSPDNDGRDDLCMIHYTLDRPNYVANLSVYDIRGRRIRKLYSNTTLSQSGFLWWDGLGENNSRLPIGVYIIVIEIFNLEGKSKKIKKTVTLVRRL